MKNAIALASCAALLAACSAAPDDPQHAGKSAGAAVVIADIGGGTNPYHEVFRRNWHEHPSRAIPGFPADAPALRLTFGSDWNASTAADAGTWASVQPGVVYWIPGTNLLYLWNDRRATTPGDDPALRPLFGDSHGTGTSAAMSNACPECWVLVVRDLTHGGGEVVRQIADRMPWVDFVSSTQIAQPSPQQQLDLGVIGPGSSYAAATRYLAEAGRLYFAASGNLPVIGLGPPPIFAWDLPPWVVAVGGAHSACSAVEWVAGDPQDFVGDFVQELPSEVAVRERKSSGGTSFATPQVAGRFGTALLALRRALGDTRGDRALWVGAPRATPQLEDGRLTPQELRETMARTAHYFATADYAPPCPLPVVVNETSIGVRPVLALPASPTPWVEMGWGYPSDADAHLAAAVILGEAPAPEKAPAAVTYMDAFMSVRSAAYGGP